MVVINGNEYEASMSYSIDTVTVSMFTDMGFGQIENNFGGATEVIVKSDEETDPTVYTVDGLKAISIWNGEAAITFHTPVAVEPYVEEMEDMQEALNTLGVDA